MRNACKISPSLRLNWQFRIVSVFTDAKNVLFWLAQPTKALECAPNVGVRPVWLLLGRLVAWQLSEFFIVSLMF